MDTLSSSVTSFKVPSLVPTSHEFHQFKPPNTPHLPHLNSTIKPNSISKRPTFSTLKNNPTASLFSSSQTSPTLKRSRTIYQKAPTGYAVALLDIAQSSNSLKVVEKDVRRYSKLLRNEQIQAIMNNPCIDYKQKGQVVREIAEKGRFHKHLFVILKILIEKNKLGMVGEVLEEFERIYDELSGTRVVLVSSEKKMEEDQLFGIAKRVQKLSGAMKVKVRNLVDEDSYLASFAV